MQRQILVRSNPSYWINKCLDFREAIFKQGIVPLFLRALREGRHNEYQEKIQKLILPLLNLLTQEEIVNRQKGIKSKNLTIIEDTHIKGDILRWSGYWGVSHYKQFALSVLELIDIYGYLNHLIENFPRVAGELSEITISKLESLELIFREQCGKFSELIKNIPHKSDKPEDFTAINSSIGLIKEPFVKGIDGLVLSQSDVNETKEGPLPVQSAAPKTLQDDLAFLQKLPVSLRIKNIIAASKTEESRQSLNYPIRKYLLSYASSYKKSEGLSIRGLTEIPSESKISDEDLINNPKAILLQTPFIESQDDLEKLINLIDYIIQVSQEENLQIIDKVKNRIDALLSLHKSSANLETFKTSLDTFVEMTKLYCHAKRFEELTKKEKYRSEITAPPIPSKEDNIKVLKEWAKATTLSIESRRQEILADLEIRKREEATIKLRERRKEEELRRKEEELRQQTPEVSAAPVHTIPAEPSTLVETKPKKTPFYKKHPFIAAGIVIGLIAAVGVCVFCPPAAVGLAKGVVSLVSGGAWALAEAAGAIHFVIGGMTLFLGSMALSGLGWVGNKICCCGKSSTKDGPSLVVSSKSSPNAILQDRTLSKSTAGIYQSMGSQPAVTSEDVPQRTSRLKSFSDNFRASRASPSLRRSRVVPVTSAEQDREVVRALP